MSIPQLGAIEGFYGRPWDPAARLAMAEWLAAIGLDLYLYAPKQDGYLRRQWASDWPAPERAALRQVADRCRDSGLDFAIGLSPFALYREYGAGQRAKLQARVRQIEDIGISTLALLFDDMPGDCEALAERQGEIVRDVAEALAPRQLLVCPTYYSDDPALDRFFGTRPEGYLAALGAALPPGASLFWTGPLVCSERIAPDDLPARKARGGAAIALWDNYPVNDSKLRSPHLYLSPLSGRPAGLAGELSGHYCNAMNQPALSLPALASLPALYGRDAPDREAALSAAGIDDELRSACAPLSVSSLQDLSVSARARLDRVAAGGSMAARELRGFLRGDYRFDPACLND